MKRLATLFFVMSLMFSSLPMNVCYAAEYQENVLDKIKFWPSARPIG